jgi:hypothetical protein
MSGEPHKSATHEQLMSLDLRPEYELRLTRGVNALDALAQAVEAYRLAVDYCTKQTPSLAIRAAASGDRALARCRRELLTVTAPSGVGLGQKVRDAVADVEGEHGGNP